MYADVKKLSETGKKVLAAATKVFAAKGYKGATTSEIAREAGVAEGTIYKHFKSKRELYFSLFVPAIIEQKLPDILGGLEKTLAAHQGQNEKEVFKALLENRLQLLRENIDVLRLVLSEAQYHLETRELLIRKIVIPSRAILVTYIEDRKQKGTFRQDINPGVAARSIAAAFLMYILWYELVAEHAPADSFLDEQQDLDQVIDLLFNGMLV